MGTIDWNNVRLISPGGIRHKVVGGLTPYGDDETLSADLTLMIQTSDFPEFLEEMFPTPELIGDFVSLAPRLYLINAPYLRLKSFKSSIVEGGKPIDPFNADPDAADGTYGTLMQLDLTFSTMNESDENEPDEGDPTTFLEHSVNAGSEYLQIPPKKLDVAEGDVDAGAQNQEANQDIKLGVYKNIITIEHSLKWKFALNPAWSTIFETLGKVNSSAIPLFKNAKKETVLFSGISGQQSYRFFRRRTTASPWSLDFKFSQRYIHEGNETFGWNHVYSPSKNKWVRPIRANDGNKPLYQRADLAQLFRAGS